MKVDNISQLMRYNALQNLSNLNNNSTVTNSKVVFPMMLDEMLQNAEVKETKNKLKNNKLKSDNNSKATSGADSLSLQPQQMARMIRLLAEQSALAGLNSIGSMGNGYYSGNSMMCGNSYTTLMLGYMLGKMAEDHNED